MGTGGEHGGEGKKVVMAVLSLTANRSFSFLD
jgi:hypothetical protein